MSETPHFGFMAHVEFPLVQSLLVHGPASRIVFFFFLQHWRLIVSLKLWIRAVILRRSLVFYFYVDTFPFTYGTKMICFKNCTYRRSLPQRGYKLKLRKRLYINKKAVSRNQSEIVTVSLWGYLWTLFLRQFGKRDNWMASQTFMGKTWSTEVLVCRLDFRLRDAGIPGQLVVKGNILTKLRDGEWRNEVQDFRGGWRCCWICRAVWWMSRRSRLARENTRCCVTLLSLHL